MGIDPLGTVLLANLLIPVCRFPMMIIHMGTAEIDACPSAHIQQGHGVASAADADQPCALFQLIHFYLIFHDRIIVQHC